MSIHSRLVRRTHPVFGPQEWLCTFQHLPATTIFCHCYHRAWGRWLTNWLQIRTLQQIACWPLLPLKVLAPGPAIPAQLCPLPRQDEWNEHLNLAAGQFHQMHSLVIADSRHSRFKKTPSSSARECYKIRQLLIYVAKDEAASEAFLRILVAVSITSVANELWVWDITACSLSGCALKLLPQILPTTAEAASYSVSWTFVLFWLW